MKKENKIIKNKKPWPTKKAMEQVYDMKLWGSNYSKFYSGDGSHQSEIVKPYIAIVASFLTSFKNKISVLDLGCGDFNIGKNLVHLTNTYIAVDIVPDLIEHNKKQFKNRNLSFQCLDIAEDHLPKADCVILRQVLQHLSNAEVQKIASKLTNYKYIILTEHLPNGNFTPNKNIISGQGIRLKKQSGIDLLAAPFHLKVQEEKQLLAYNLKGNKGVIVTTLYKLF
ncbi:class I SAM-dependent methyltransferase [uncultured Polaribacter sp.]|uniref:class I SAM-dependent methyltransferase n=1 Tax=uncultured Polaribacter sp. TaxID=174711 RepID=UPI00261421C1|nr:class I SAM-dependent methyltransferase [uncultured Polaribacter sp.]